MGGAGVLARVAIRRVVATQRDAALLAGPQVHPRGVDLHALLADALLRLFDVRNGFDMRATVVWHETRPPTLLDL
jgi:hypothetical protein